MELLFQKGYLRHFVNPKKYKKRSELKDGILYFTGRILPTEKINGKLNLGDVCLDIYASTFVCLY